MEQTQNTASPNTDANDRQSQLATVLIGVLIVVAGFLIYTVFNNQSSLEPLNDIDVNEDGTILEEDGDGNATPTETAVTEQPEGGSYYQVREGDTLWSIAQRAYNDGYQWRVIADENSIPVQDTQLEVGDELFIPAIGGPADEDDQDDQEGEQEQTEDETTEPDEEPTTEPTQGAEEPTDENGEEATEEETEATIYTVERGDTLWSIAQKLYGDGNKWRLIYEAEENEINLYTSVTTGETYPIIHAGNVLVIPAAQ